MTIRSPPAGVSHCDDLWFEDGNLILQAEDVQFRVHRSVLARHSEIFKDMVSIPQPLVPSGETVMLEGCPVVHLSDSAVQVKHFVGLLYDGVQEMYRGKSPRNISMSRLEAMARLGKKYDVRCLQDCAYAYLLCDNPYKLEEWDRSFENDADELIIHDEEEGAAAVNLVFEMSFQRLLPAALLTFLAAEENIEKVFANASRCPMRRDLYVQCLLGRESLIHWMNQRYSDELPWCSRILRNCSAQGSCAGAITHSFNRWSLWPWRKRMGIFTWLRPWNDAHITGLCPTCLVACCKKYEEIRMEAWTKLPEFFGLGKWDDLKDDI